MPTENSLPTSKSRRPTVGRGLEFAHLAPAGARVPGRTPILPVRPRATDVIELTLKRLKLAVQQSRSCPGCGHPRHLVILADQNRIGLHCDNCRTDQTLDDATASR